MREPRLDALLLATVMKNSTLCHDVGNPGWDNAGHYSVDHATGLLYLGVSTKMLEGKDANAYEVLIWSEPRVVVTGRLSPATAESEVATRRRLLLAEGRRAEAVDYILFDQRTHKPRKHLYKMEVIGVRRPVASDVRTRYPTRVLGTNAEPTVRKSDA